MTDLQLIRGECLSEMAKLPDACVDMVMCDLPYGTTACAWDSVIDLSSLWTQYKRLCTGAVVLTATEPFSFTLVASKVDSFRYLWIWDKRSAGNFVQAKRMPLRSHENVLIFNFSEGMPRYNPQMTQLDKPRVKKGTIPTSDALPIKHATNFQHDRTYDVAYPKTVIYVEKGAGDRGIHPTQKPVALMEYLIKTYTNEGMTVLDNCMGSGTTGVACVNTNRNFIGIERDDKYFEIAKNRIEAARTAKEVEQLESLFV